MSERSFLGGLPRRDLVLLPLISILTVAVMLGCAEIAARVFWPEQLVDACALPNGELGFRPNCVSRMKGFEGPWFTDSYNECGYRSTASCGTPPVGTRRVALVGSSVSEGFLVPYAKTAGAVLAADLSRRCPFPVEVQNLGMRGINGWRIVERTDAAMALHPAAVLMLVGTFDIESQLDDSAMPITSNVSVPPVAAPKLAAPATALPKGMLAGKLVILMHLSRAEMVAQSLLLRNSDTFLSLYLHYGDKADFLRPPFTPAWQERLRRFNLLIARLSERAHAGGANFTIAFIPQQAQLTLMQRRALPPGIDPRALPQALAAIAARHGADFVDVSPDFAADPDAQRLYYHVDGHPSTVGDPLIAAALLRHYVGEAGGPFASCAVTTRQQALR